MSKEKLDEQYKRLTDYYRKKLKGKRVHTIVPLLVREEILLDNTHEEDDVDEDEMEEDEMDEEDEVYEDVQLGGGGDARRGPYKRKRSLLELTSSQKLRRCKEVSSNIIFKM